MELIHEIKGKKYILIVDFVRSIKGLVECAKRMKKHNCIFHKMEYAQKGFFYPDKKATNVFILVPEENIIEFNNEIIDFDYK